MKSPTPSIFNVCNMYQHSRLKKKNGYWIHYKWMVIMTDTTDLHLWTDLPLGNHLLRSSELPITHLTLSPNICPFRLLPRYVNFTLSSLWQLAGGHFVQDGRYMSRLFVVFDSWGEKSLITLLLVGRQRRHKGYCHYIMAGWLDSPWQCIM